MRLRQIFVVVVVIGMLMPVATATMAPASTPLEQGRSNPASDSVRDTDESTDPANYTRLYIDDRYQRLRLKPGETDSVTITVANVDEEPVEIDPQLVASNPRSRPIDDAWVTIDAAKTTLDPDEEVDVTVTVRIPDEAKLGDYRSEIAFTDERVTYPGRPARPVHAAGLHVEVWREPTVRILSGRYLNTQVEAGSSKTHEIIVENTGDEAVPVNPEIETNGAIRCYEVCPTTVDRSWFDIDAPTEIGPGEQASIEVSIEPPEDADRGRYNARLNLGIKDPARAERDDHWQRVRLGFQVWKQPDQPFEAEFAVSGDATDITLELSPRHPSHYRSGSDSDAESPSFDVEFVSPTGAVVEPERVQLRDQGFVDLSGERRQVVSDEDYAVRGNGQQFVYQLDDPESGTWTVRIMPHNTVGFGYEIVRNESAN